MSDGNIAVFYRIAKACRPLGLKERRIGKKKEALLLSLYIGFSALGRASEKMELGKNSSFFFGAHEFYHLASTIISDKYGSISNSF